MEFLKKLFAKNGEQKPVVTGEVVDQTELDQMNQTDEITTGTKIKVVAALVVVGFAAYVAYWIQEPMEIRADLLGSNTQSSSMATSTSQQASATQEVSISNFAFDPSVLNITKGQTVVWTNKDTVPHNVVGDNFASPTLNPGESFTYTFNTEGSSAYQCTFHPQMKAYVVVAAAPGSVTKDQVLSGFGAGMSLGSVTPPPSDATIPADTTTQEVAPAESPVDAAIAPVDETIPPPVTPEPIFTSAAPAPTPDLHGAAALQPLSESLSNIGNVAASADGGATASAQGNTAMTAEQQQALAAEQAKQALASSKGKLASSGPEDVIYYGIFGTILFLNRKKLSKLRKSM